MPSRTPRPRDCGSASVELVILTPALLAFLLLAIYGGRLALARHSVQAAASDAARSASIARSVTMARADARHSALATLDSEGLDCRSTSVSIDARAFQSTVGTDASVEVTVACTVTFGDLALPGLPGTRLVRATAVSPLDTYRER